MLRPVIASDGRRYECWHLWRWLRFDSRSPVTYEWLDVSDVATDAALQAEIWKFLEVNILTGKGGGGPV